MTTAPAFAEDLESAGTIMKPLFEMPTPGNGLGHGAREAQDNDAQTKVVQLREGGQRGVEAQEVSVDLSQLHAAIGLYARTLADVQHMRVILESRAASALTVTHGISPVFAVVLVKQVRQTKADEHAIELHLKRLVRQHPLRTFIESSPGIGLKGFGLLFGVTGPLDQFPNVAKLWKYLGLAVVDGHRQRMPSGQLASHTNCAGGTHFRVCKPNCTTDHHPHCTPDGFGTAYSPRGLVVCHQIGEAIEMLKPGNGPYREAYERRKSNCLIKHPEWTPMHRRADARRVAVKALTADLWGAWRDTVQH